MNAPRFTPTITADVIDLADHRVPDPASLIADFGHPHWPGWQYIMAALVVMQAYILFQPLDMSMVRPSSSPVRTVRPPTARTGRTGRTARNQKTAGAIQ